MGKTDSGMTAEGGRMDEYINIEKIPFSMAGSYLAVSRFLAGMLGHDTEEGVYLRSVHGTGYMPGFTMMRSLPFCARIIPVYAGEEIEYEIDAGFFELRLVTKYGSIDICYADPDTLLIKGTGEGLGVDFKLPQGNLLQQVSSRELSYLLMNCRLNDRKIAVSQQQGSLYAQQEEKMSGRSARICCRPDKGGFQLAVQDANPHWKPEKKSYDYDSCRSAVRSGFQEFTHGIPGLTGEYAGAGRMAAYVDWAGMVRKEGLLTRDAMLMSKNQMCNVWSWDHCFNAVALSYWNPEAAWEQFMLLFDYQDEMGALPDSVSDAYVARAFLKPPIHGWALSKMMEHMAISDKQCQEVYGKLEKWTNWWLIYRDSDDDGICEYFHGHDSGWDNSTAFDHGENMELPDLSAFLILQMETLAQLADRLQKSQEAAAWKQKSEHMLTAMVEHSFTDGRPRALESGTHREQGTDSLILYLPILLGKRLPEEVRETLIRELKSSRFLTGHGFATEAVKSDRYEADGYWRGPIWAPPTLFLTEGLYQSGEKEFACQAAERFCRMAAENGFAENYDALTGEGLRDKAYTWTASIFMILVWDYVEKRDDYGTVF